MNVPSHQHIEDDALNDSSIRTFPIVRHVDLFKARDLTSYHLSQPFSESSLNISRAISSDRYIMAAISPTEVRRGPGICAMRGICGKKGIFGAQLPCPIDDDATEVSLAS